MQKLRGSFRHAAEQIDEVNLSLTRNLGGAGDMAFAAGADARSFLDFHPSCVHAALRWHIALTSALVQIAAIAQPVEKAILADVIASGLLDKLRHFAHEDGRLCDFDGFSKDNLGAISLSLRFQNGALLAFRLQVSGQKDQSIRVQQGFFKLRRGQVGPMLTDA